MRHLLMISVAVLLSCQGMSLATEEKELPGDRVPTDHGALVIRPTP